MNHKWDLLIYVIPHLWDLLIYVIPHLWQSNFWGITFSKQKPYLWNVNCVTTIKRYQGLHLVIEESLGLLDVPQEEMEDVSLHQHLPPALPHLQQFVPAHVQLVQPLLQSSMRQRCFLRLQEIIHSLETLVVLFVLPISSLSAACWFISRSASSKALGSSSEAAAVWVCTNQVRKESKSWMNCCKRPATVKESSQPCNVCFSSSHSTLMPSKGTRISTALSGWDVASSSASSWRWRSLGSRTVRAPSMVERRRCRASTLPRSLPTYCVASMGFPLVLNLGLDLCAFQ